MTTLARRSPAEIAFDCRVNRIVDAWVSAWHESLRDGSRKPSHPCDWYELDWQLSVNCKPGFGCRRDDSPPDAAMREAVINAIDERTRAAVCAEIDAIQDRLDRRKRDEREGSDAA